MSRLSSELLRSTVVVCAVHHEQQKAQALGRLRLRLPCVRSTGRDRHGCQCPVTNDWSRTGIAVKGYAGLRPAIKHISYLRIIGLYFSSTTVSRPCVCKSVHSPRQPTQVNSVLNAELALRLCGSAIADVHRNRSEPLSRSQHQSGQSMEQIPEPGRGAFRHAGMPASIV